MARSSWKSVQRLVAVHLLLGVLYACGGTPVSPAVAPSEDNAPALAFRPTDGSSYVVYQRHVIYGADGLPDSIYEVQGRMGMRRAEELITDVTIFVDTVRVARDADDDTYFYDGQLQIVGRRNTRFRWLGQLEFQLGPDFDPQRLRQFQSLESFGHLEGELVAASNHRRVGDAWESTLGLDVGHVAGPPMLVTGRTQRLASTGQGVQLVTSFSGDGDVGGVYTTHVHSEGTARITLESVTGVPLDVETRAEFLLTRTLSDGSTSGPYQYEVHTLQLVRRDAVALALARTLYELESPTVKVLDAECREERAALRERIAASPRSIWLPADPLPTLPLELEAVRADGMGWTRVTTRTRTTDAVRPDSGIVVVLPASTPMQDVVDKLPPGETSAMLVVEDPSPAAFPCPAALANVTRLEDMPSEEQLSLWRNALLEAVGVCPAARERMRSMALSWQNTRGDVLRDIAVDGMAACGCNSVRADVLTGLAEISYGGPETVAVRVTLDTSDSKLATPLRLQSTATYQDFINALVSVDRTRPVHISIQHRGRVLPPPPNPWTPLQARAVELATACGDAAAIVVEGDRYTISLRCWDLLRSSRSPLRAFVLSNERNGGVVLHGVRRGSLEARLGFINGDVIRAISGHDVDNLASLVRVAGLVSEDHEVVINVNRRGAPHVFTYALAGFPPSVD